MKLPSFTLRELFLLVIIAAMGCGWWVDHRRSDGFLREARNRLGELLALRHEVAIYQTTWQRLDDVTRKSWSKVYEDVSKMDTRDLSFGPGRLGNQLDPSIVGLGEP